MYNLGSFQARDASCLKLKWAEIQCHKKRREPSIGKKGVEGRGEERWIQGPVTHWFQPEDNALLDKGP